MHTISTCVYIITTHVYSPQACILFLNIAIAESCVMYVWLSLVQCHSCFLVKHYVVIMCCSPVQCVCVRHAVVSTK